MGSSRSGGWNALTVDVEDWHNATILQCTGRIEPPTMSVVRNTLGLLELMEEHQTKATWFFLGEVAEAFPELVRRVAEAGHEVGVHGFHHQPLNEFDATAFKTQIARARAAVEQSSGKKVLGHRAVDFSLRKETEWALDVLAELGFLYDASLFPVWTPRYGVGGAPLAAHRVALRDGRQILEVPVSVADICGMRVPFAGGGYFRLLPLAATRVLFLLTARGRPVVFYLHPCEIEPESELGHLPDELSEQEKDEIRRCFRSQTRGRAQGVRKLRVLLSKYRFDTVENVFLGGEAGESSQTSRGEATRAPQ